MIQEGKGKQFEKSLTREGAPIRVSLALALLVRVEPIKIPAILDAQCATGTKIQSDVVLHGCATLRIRTL